MTTVKLAEPILVIGHRNPDTDAIASALGYAWVLNALETTAPDGTRTNYAPGRTGEVNAQTAFALSRFGIEPPSIVTDIWNRVGDLTAPLPPLRAEQEMLSAVQSIAQTRRSVPVLDAEGRPLGLLTGAAMFASLADPLSTASVMELARGLAQPVKMAIDGPGLTLRGQERVRDVLNQVLRSDQDEFLVVDESGAYVGLCRKSALLAPPHRRVVIVDHNEAQQAVPGLEDAELLEVLDHHRLGNPATAVAIRFIVEPVGSCSTLVAERALRHDLRLPPAIAGLLLCGILSDTLIFRSPTTTAREKVAAHALAAMAGLEADGAGDYQAAIEALGNELLAAGAGLGARPAEEIINTDLKFYEVNGNGVGIAQVEVTNLRELAPRLGDLHEALRQLGEGRKLALSMLMVTDVVRSNSQLVVVGQPRLISALPYANVSEGVLDAPGVVSRKKQLLPTVLAALSQAV
jgi:manganese-dependent inorganic pyrophosphatase